MTEYPNWFAQTAQHNFEKHLLPLAGKHLHCLQLGVFTGDASVWLCNNVLTHRDSKLQDVDTWKGSDEEVHTQIDFQEVRQYYFSRTQGMPISFSEVYEYYKKRMEPYNNLRSVRNNTFNFLINNRDKYDLFDFIYVDADHTTVGVLLDAELSWPLLKSGGIMAFDDYTWGHESGDPRLAPQVGIDLFLHRHQGDYELLAKNTQVWIKKK